jgi:hypothetical protein
MLILSFTLSLPESVRLNPVFAKISLFCYRIRENILAFVFSMQEGSRIRPCVLVGGITRTFCSMYSLEGRKNLCVLIEELKGLFHVEWEQEESVCPSRKT